MGPASSGVTKGEESPRLGERMGAAFREAHWRKAPRFCAQEVAMGEHGSPGRLSLLSVLPPAAKRRSSPCSALAGAGISRMVPRPPLPPSHPHTGQRPSRPARKCILPTVKPLPVPASALSAPFSLLLCAPSPPVPTRPPPCLCTCCCRHPAPPRAQPQSSPFGKACQLPSRPHFLSGLPETRNQSVCERPWHRAWHLALKGL